MRRAYRPVYSASLLLFIIAQIAISGTRSLALQAVAPQVTKLEPPNWWIDFVPAPGGAASELELMITGKNLEGAKMACSSPGVSIVRSKVTDGGHYMFAWLSIAPDAHPGTAALQVQTAAGSTSVNFPLERRSSSEGKFQGLLQDDVIYLIMPDRFADGDTSNDNLANSPGTYDRSKARAYHGGDLLGIRDHLDYLRGLGITTIWLTPIVQNDPGSAQDYHGYGAVDEYAVEDHFGTLADLQDLVRAAHSKGLKIILDFVPNHVGPRNPWVDAPAASYTTTTPGPGTCRELGSTTAFDSAKLDSLYGNHKKYEAKVAESVDAMVKERWITKSDAQKIKADAAAGKLD